MAVRIGILACITVIVSALPLSASADNLLDCIKNHYILTDDGTCVSPQEKTPTFRINRVASTQDGDEQIIELVESAGRDNQNGFKGVSFWAINRDGVAKRFVFPADLQFTKTAGGVILIATVGTREWYHAPAADFYIPNGFIPTDGATLSFGDADSWEIQPMPQGGEVARDGDAAGLPPSHYYLDNWDIAGAQLVDVRQYYNAQADRYFLTGSQPDIDALDSGRIPGWTGGVLFQTWSSPTLVPWWSGDPHPLMPVCRYLLPSGAHLFSAAPEECAAFEKAEPEAILESPAAFYAFLPDRITGQCTVPGYVLPLYRLRSPQVDGGQVFAYGGDFRNAMLAKGWVPEGFGPDGAAMCVPVWY